MGTICKAMRLALRGVLCGSCATSPTARHHHCNRGQRMGLRREFLLSSPYCIRDDFAELPPGNLVRTQP